MKFFLKRATQLPWNQSNLYTPTGTSTGWIDPAGSTLVVQFPFLPLSSIQVILLPSRGPRILPETGAKGGPIYLKVKERGLPSVMSKEEGVIGINHFPGIPFPGRTLTTQWPAGICFQRKVFFVHIPFLHSLDVLLPRETHSFPAGQGNPFINTWTPRPGSQRISLGFPDSRTYSSIGLAVPGG